MTYDAIIFTGGILSSVKPFGAYKVAHELRSAGFTTLVVNHVEYFNVSELKEILDKAVGPNTLFVGVSNTFFTNLESSNPALSLDGVDSNRWLPATYTQREETDVCKHIKALNPNTKIVLGGTRTHFNILNTNIDYVFIGYSDQSIVNFARHLSRGDQLQKAKRNLAKIWVIDDGVAKDFDFVNSSMQWTDDDIVLPGETLPIEIARGCIFSCKFCSYRLNGKQALDYIKDFNNIRNELMYNYERYGVTCYRFLDDTFNDSEEKIDAILKISESLPFELKFWAYIRIDLLATRPHTIDKLYRAGLRSIFFGIETLNRKTGLLIGKGFDPDRVVETIDMLKETYGNSLYIHASFICGLPEEDLTSVNHTMERLLSREINLDSYKYFSLGISRKGTHTWESAFNMDMQKYGYSEDVDDKESSKRIVPWKNKYMTYKQAKSRVDEFEKLTEQSNRITVSPMHQKLTAGEIVSEKFLNIYLTRYKKQLHKILDQNQ